MTRRAALLIGLVLALAALPVSMVAALWLSFGGLRGPLGGLGPVTSYYPGVGLNQGLNPALNPGLAYGGGLMAGQGAAAGWSNGGQYTGPLFGVNGSGPVSFDQAWARAQEWVLRYLPGGSLDSGVSTQSGLQFTVSRSGRPVGVVVVDTTTGAVWGWVTGVNG